MFKDNPLGWDPVIRIGWHFWDTLVLNLTWKWYNNCSSLDKEERYVYIFMQNYQIRLHFGILGSDGPSILFHGWTFLLWLGTYSPSCIIAKDIVVYSMEMGRLYSGVYKWGRCLFNHTSNKWVTIFNQNVTPSFLFLKQSTQWEFWEFITVKLQNCT